MTQEHLITNLQTVDDRLPTSNPQPAFQEFDLDAGVLCLDFANTLGLRSGEHLLSYTDLVAFALQSSLVTRATAEKLQASGQRHAKGGGDVLARAKRLRGALRGIFSAIALEQRPQPKDLALLNRELSNSLRFAQVVPAPSVASTRSAVAVSEPAGGGSDAGEPASLSYVWAWNTDRLRMDEPIWSIVRSAADLLASTELLRAVRQCGADDCQWLFLDTSKNRSRQWCSMTSCGNREKARRHYERVRAQRRSIEVEPNPPGQRAATRRQRRAPREELSARS